MMNKSGAAQGTARRLVEFRLGCWVDQKAELKEAKTEADKGAKTPALDVLVSAACG